MLIDAFVLIGHTVEVEEVGDLAFLVTLDLLALQRSDLIPSDIVPILSLTPEVVLAPVGRKLRLEPLQQKSPELSLCGQTGNDALEQVDQRLFVFSRLGQCRAPAFGFTDDRHAQAVERPDCHAGRRFVAETLADPHFHLVPGVLRKRQEQQFRRAPVTSMEKPAGLGDDHRGLAAAGRGDHQIAVLVDDDRPALLVGKRPRLNPVEELPQPGQFVCDKGAVRFCPQTIGVFQKVQYRPQRSDFRGVRQRVRPTARELVRRLLRVASQFAEDAARHVLRRIRELHQAVMDRTERRDPCRQRPAPPVDSGGHQRLRERSGVIPRQPRHERFPCGMTKAYAAPVPTGFDFGRHDVSERDFRVSGPMRQSQGIRVHGSSPGVFRAKDCEQERRQPGSSDRETNYSFRGVHGPRLLPGFFTRPGLRLCLFAHNRLSVRNGCVVCNDNT